MAVARSRVGHNVLAWSTCSGLIVFADRASRDPLTAGVVGGAAWMGALCTRRGSACERLQATWLLLTWICPFVLIARAVQAEGYPSYLTVLMSFLECYLITGTCMTVCMHRYFAHSAFRTSRAFQLVLAVMGCLCYQGSPIWWASKHRRHHKHCDQPSDPHSAFQTSHWYAWWGWTIHPAEQSIDRDYVSKLLGQTELVIVSRLCWLWPLLAALAVRHAFGFYNMVCFATTPMLASRFITLLFNVEFHPSAQGTEKERAWCKGIDLSNIFADFLGEACHEHHHEHPRTLNRPSAGFPWIDVPYYGMIAPLLYVGLIWPSETKSR